MPRPETGRKMPSSTFPQKRVWKSEPKTPTKGKRSKGSRPPKSKRQQLGTEHRKSQKGNIPGFFNGLGDIPLMLGAIPRNSPGKNLASLGDEVIQGFHVFVIDLHAAVGAENANFAPLKSPFSLHGRFHFSSPPASVFAASTGAGVGSGAAGRSSNGRVLAAREAAFKARICSLVTRALV